MSDLESYQEQSTEYDVSATFARLGLIETSTNVRSFLTTALYPLNIDAQHVWLSDLEQTITFAQTHGFYSKESDKTLSESRLCGIALSIMSEAQILAAIPLIRTQFSQNPAITDGLRYYMKSREVQRGNSIDLYQDVSPDGGSVRFIIDLAAARCADRALTTLDSARANIRTKAQLAQIVDPAVRYNALMYHSYSALGNLAKDSIAKIIKTTLTMENDMAGINTRNVVAFRRSAFRLNH